MILTRIVDPTAEPVSISGVKRSLRISHYQDDEFLTDLIKEARQFIGDRWGRIYLEETWTQVMDADELPEFKLDILKYPLSSITSITYTDTNGDSQTFSSSLYTVDTTRYPGIVYPSYLQLWPFVRSYPSAMTVTFVAGYADVDSIPMPMLKAMHYYVGHYNENRLAPPADQNDRLLSTLRSLLGMPLREIKDDD